MIKRILGDIQKSGTQYEGKYWDIKSSGNGTSFDNMCKYLNSQGFSGHPRDMFRAWAKSKGANSGTTYDNMKNYYDKTATP